MPDTRIRPLILAVALLAAVSLAAQEPLNAFDDEGYDEAISTIRCDCGCHPQSVKDCACGRAAQMREQFHERIAGGETGEQLIASFVAEHGEQIRIAPTATGFNLLAWLGPAVALLLAATMMILMLRRWRGTAPAPAAAPADALPADDEYMARVQRELKEMQ